MANDSPAKSLVDIDLASLRVSAAEPSLCFFVVLLCFIPHCSIKHTSHSVTNLTKLTRSQMSLLVRAEVLKMTAEPQRGVASVWFSFVRDAFGM